MGDGTDQPMKWEWIRFLHNQPEGTDAIDNPFFISVRFPVGRLPSFLRMEPIVVKNSSSCCLNRRSLYPEDETKPDTLVPLNCLWNDPSRPERKSPLERTKSLSPRPIPVELSLIQIRCFNGFRATRRKSCRGNRTTSCGIPRCHDASFACFGIPLCRVKSCLLIS